jgi:hypothetical protein
MKKANETNENYCHIEARKLDDLRRLKERQTDKENLYKECIEMLQSHDPNGEYWAVIFEHGKDYDKAMQVVRECVAMSLNMAIADKEMDSAKFYIKVLSKAIKLY